MTKLAQSILANALQRGPRAKPDSPKLASEYERLQASSHLILDQHGRFRLTPDGVRVAEAALARRAQCP